MDLNEKDLPGFATMDLNEKGVLFCRCTNSHSDNEGFGDTTLGLDCFGHGCGGDNNSSEFSSSTRHHFEPFSSNPVDDGCRLGLGLGPTPISLSSKQKQSNESLSSSLLVQGSSSSSGSDFILKLGLSASRNVSLLCPFEFSTSNPTKRYNTTTTDKFSYLVLDEGSTSAKKSGGYTSTLLLAPSMRPAPSPNSSSPLFTCKQNVTGLWSNLENSQFTMETSTMTTTTTPTKYSLDLSAAITSISHEHLDSRSGKCKHVGCTKGARGASSLCIGHGGGQRCQKPGCSKGAESRTAYCKAHGGGRRCQQLGCTKSADGKTNYCIAHGGGRRCSYPEGCLKAARGKSGLCIRHGGGKRCQIEGCCRSAEGQAGLCISHGGGRRCRAPECTKGAQGSTLFCKAHGGGKRCIFVGCNKGAEGSTPLCKAHGGGKRCLFGFDGGGNCPKSVHGGTNFCVAHGGGKRCSMPGCTRSARGRTDYCVRHGGGKRCRVENCGKSAQGSTEFCKAQGGGKRCCWNGAIGGEKCEKFARGKSGLCAAHCSLVNGKGGWEGVKNAKRGTGTTNARMIGPGLFSGLVTRAGGSTGAGHGRRGGGEFDRLREESAVSDCCDMLMQRQAKRTMMIPRQVLVPPWMKSQPTREEHCAAGNCDGEGGTNGGGVELGIPEGRVHGGGLMSLLGGSLSNAASGM